MASREPLPSENMKWGDLKAVFEGVAWKELTPHEVDPTVSHGHEFQGTARLKELLGESERDLPATYMLLNEETDDIESIRAVANWYDSRAGQPHRSPEWRLYYSASADAIVSRMTAGDFLVIGLTKTDELAILFARKNSGREAQLRLLFDLPGRERAGLTVKRFVKEQALGFLGALILEELGLGRVEAPTDGDGAVIQRLAADLSSNYESSLPSGREVSDLVRKNLPGVDAVNEPDDALLRWIEAETAVFRAWEDGRIANRIIEGFVLTDGGADIEGYRQFSMSLRQSRVSRAGGALEAHFETILRAHRIRFDSQPRIDGGERPDFLFPGKAEYDDPSYPADRLRMLGAKFTAKDRWRQILSEAIRITRKHLLTLEATISAPQLSLMRSQNLQPVIPLPIHRLYPESSQAGLFSIADFLKEVRAL